MRTCHQSPPQIASCQASSHLALAAMQWTSRPQPGQSVMCRGVVTTSNDNQIAVIEMIQHIFFCEGDHNISGGGGNGMLPCGSG